MPLLAPDRDEHAYHMVFGAAAAQYVDAFMQIIDWEQVYGRYRAAVNGASESVAAPVEDAGRSHLVDVRRRAVFETADQKSQRG